MSTQPEPGFTLEWTDGEKLRKVRRFLGLTQQEFADRLDVNGSTYMAWESDRNRIADPKALAQRLRMMAGVPMWWFLDTEEPNPSGPEGGDQSLLSGSNRRPSAYMVASGARIIQFPTPREADDDGLAATA